MTAQSNITPESIISDLRYLQLLSRSFPTIADASTEIINLEAILNLPKGTEHFLTDIHGEYEAFQHVLKNASGAVKRKVNEIFGNTLRESEKKEISTLIYYPEEKLQLVKAREKDLDDWYLITLNQLVKVCQNVSSKYTRSKVRKSLPKEFSYIIQELLHESSIEPNKHAYINVIISTIITTKRADAFIIAMCNLIQRLTIDSLHIVGDIYDRGPGAHIIMDTLCDYHNFDIQWGNHDILWMGAASGNTIYVAGGNRNGSPSTSMLSLNLDEPELGWKEEVPFPGAARVQPVCAVQDGMLYLWGGFCPSQNGGEASVATDGYRYLPLQERWEPVPAPAVAETGEPLTLTGGTSCVWSDSIILCTGGVDKDIFLDAISGDYKRIAKEDYLLQPVAWYRFNGRLMAYNTRRNHWEEWEESACLARAGAALLGKGQQLFIVGGELKPGIRTAEISRITIK